MQLRIFILVFFFAVSAFAQSTNRNWTRYDIPNAQCGNGDPYSIFISTGTTNKVAMVFQGGGACWSESTCFGLIKLTDLKGQTSVNETGGVFSLNPQRSPLSDTTMILFPYCTGDVHAGNHIAEYSGKKVRHLGANNIVQAFSYLTLNQGEIFKKADQLVVYGYSAGALGALVHAYEIDQLFGRIPKKSLMLDAPGLHWGDTFWQKFTPELFHDYETAMGALGYKINLNEGVIAPIVPMVCKHLPDWNIGVMQSSRDRVMSTVFGDISMSDHEARVYGAGGIFELTKDPVDNCSAWTPAGSTHAFLSQNKSGLPTAGGYSPVQFFQEILKGAPVGSFR